MPHNISVLVIEDEFAWHRLIIKTLKHYGFKIINCVDNTEDALVAISKGDYHIALVDVHMGGKASGLTLGKIIRENFNKPFIFITASVDPQLFASAIDARPSAYLTKPFSPESLVITIQSALANFNPEQPAPAPVQQNIENEKSSFFVKHRNVLKRINWQDVLCLRSDKNYTAVVTRENESFMIRSSLQKTLSNIIPHNIQHKFVQINRAEVVQLAYITSIASDELQAGNLSFTMTEGYVKNLKRELHVVL